MEATALGLSKGILREHDQWSSQLSSSVLNALNDVREGCLRTDSRQFGDCQRMEAVGTDCVENMK